MDKNIPDINTQIISQLNINPSQIDDLIGKACPSAQGGNEPISSMWNFFHGVYNARLAKDLKKTFAGFNIQHEAVDGSCRMDIRLIADYRNKIIVGDKNLVVIDLKTGNIKLYQLCLYALKSRCPVIIVELLSADIHIVTPEAASRILMNMPSELERIKELRSLNATLPGQDCRFCSKQCKERFSKYSPYKVSSTDLAERALKLESNYNIVKEKVQEIIRSIIETKIKASAKEDQSTSPSAISKAIEELNNTNSKSIAHENHTLTPPQVKVNN